MCTNVHPLLETIIALNKYIELIHSIAFLLCSLGPKGEAVQVKLFPQTSGDYTGEFTPTKIGKLIEFNRSKMRSFFFD